MALFRSWVLLLFVISFAASSDLCAGEEGFSSNLASVVDANNGRPEIKWDYSDGPNGPAHWGNLSRDWLECRRGTRQSPIDVQEEFIKLDGLVDTPANISYRGAPAFIRGDGNVLEMDWAGGTFNCHEVDFLLENLVFHAPSEHTYFGERFPLEIQFYHTHPEQGVAINSVMFRDGEANDWLQQIAPSLPGPSSVGQTISLGMVESTGVGLDELKWSRYYRYLGSLSTPPCTQRPSVTWSLLESPLTASKEQIDRVVAALLYAPNVRPTQAVNGRHIYFPKGAAGGH